jgi:hypothetical protein
LKKEFVDFAAKVKSATNEEVVEEEEDDDEDDFDYTTVWKWIKNLFSYRLYKETDVKQMQTELRKHKVLCEEMCNKSHFWKGKICHFLETGQQDWKISDKYFVNLGHKNRLALE